MSPLLQFMLALGLMISAAKLAGLLSRRIGQPAVLGELLAGVLLGPSAVNLLGLPFMSDQHLGDSLAHLAELGVMFLMFVAGLEVDLAQMRKSGRAVLLAGTLGVLIPLGLGWASALPFGFGAQGGLYMGMLLTATSVSISAQTLLELGVLRSRVGLTLLGAAVVDDILVIVLLSVLLALAGGSAGAAGILLLLVRMVAYLLIFSLAGSVLLPRIARWAADAPISEGLLATTVVVVVFYAWAAEVVGQIAVITGALLAGLLLARTPQRHRIEEGMHALSYGFFVPIFFVNIGLHANVWALSGSLVALTAVLTVVAVISKLLGSGLGGLLSGFSMPDAVRLGAGMVSRGEVGLIVASLLVQHGLLPPEILTVAVVMVLVTTLVTPPALRLLFGSTTQPAAEAGRSTPLEEGGSDA